MFVGNGLSDTDDYILDTEIDGVEVIFLWTDRLCINDMSDSLSAYEPCGIFLSFESAGFYYHAINYSFPMKPLREIAHQNWILSGFTTRDLHADKSWYH